MSDVSAPFLKWTESRPRQQEYKEKWSVRSLRSIRPAGALLPFSFPASVCERGRERGVV